MDLEEWFNVSDASAQYPDNFNVIKMQKRGAISVC